MDRERRWLARFRRLHKLHVTTAILGVHTDPYLDGVHQRADKGDPTGLLIQRLRHEEQGAALTQLTDLAQHALKEEMRIFEGDILIEKGGAGTQEDD